MTGRVSHDQAKTGNAGCWMTGIQLFDSVRSSPSNACALAGTVRAEGAPQGIKHVDALPGKQAVARNASEMAVRGSRFINRPLQVERLDNGGWTEIEQLTQR